MVSSSPWLSYATLTDRERDILGLLDEGLSDKEIAEKRVLSLGTVKWYNHQIYEKLGVKSRTQAINRAREYGLFSPALSIAAPDLAPSRHNLPAETTRFIGREREISEIKSLLRTTRLLTLTGSPGTGKTRLSLRVAADVLSEFPDGVYFVNLARIPDPAYVAMGIADALGIEERKDEPLINTLKSDLRDRELLLLLDNFEHLLGALGLVSDLLANAPGLKILVTSREALRIYGEQEYVVPPLQLPDAETLADLAECEAIALFIQQARAVKPDLVLTDESRRDIARICIRLDGLPLAIELAAAHSKFLSPKALLERLKHPIDTLVRGSRDLPDRQQTLRRTIDWSYTLLNEGEKRLFARLGIFSGGWTLEAMQAVCDEALPLDSFDGLESLVNKSLVRHYDSQGMPRFTMLEMLREYAVEQLEASGEMEMLRQRHAHYYTELAELMEQGLQGKKECSSLDNLEVEHDNFRTVLSWSLNTAPEPGLRLIAALSHCWRIRGHLLEGWRWSRNLIEKGERADQVDKPVLAGALASATMLAYRLGHYEQSEQMAHKALTMAREVGNSSVLAWASHAAGMAKIQPDMTDSDYQEADALLDEALVIFRAQPHMLGIAKCLTIKGELARLQSRLEWAVGAYQEAASLFSQLGNSVGVSTNLANLAWVSQRRGDDARAEQLFRESLSLAQAVHDRGSIVNALAGLAALAVKANELDRAVQLFGVMEAQKQTYGNVLCTTDQADYEPFIATARSRMDQPTFAQRWEEGNRLTLEEAIARATV